MYVSYDMEVLPLTTWPLHDVGTKAWLWSAPQLITACHPCLSHPMHASSPTQGMTSVTAPTSAMTRFSGALHAARSRAAALSPSLPPATLSLATRVAPFSGGPVKRGTQ
jgi:hypothetical protein